MSSPVSHFTAETFTKFIESKICSFMKGKLIFWRRYVDDIFITVHRNNAIEIIETNNETVLPFWKPNQIRSFFLCISTSVVMKVNFSHKFFT